MLYSFPSNCPVLFLPGFPPDTLNVILSDLKPWIKQWVVKRRREWTFLGKRIAVAEERTRGRERLWGGAGAVVGINMHITAENLKIPHPKTNTSWICPTVIFACSLWHFFYCYAHFVLVLEIDIDRFGSFFLLNYWSLGSLLGFSGSSDSTESTCNAGNLGLIPELGRSPGEENGYPLQYSCLENSMDRETWQATVHGVAESRTQLIN